MEESPDTMDQNNNVGVLGQDEFIVAPSGSSPDGGTWVGIGREVTGFIERFGQTVVGFVPGTTYTIQWYMGNFGYSPSIFFYNAPNSIEILVAGISVGTGPVLATGPDWFLQSLLFTATANTHDVAFQPGIAAKSYVSIDGIQIQEIPEPRMTWIVGGVAFVALFVRYRRRITTRRTARFSRFPALADSQFSRMSHHLPCD
jgi:hypothetical protein